MYLVAIKKKKTMTPLSLAIAYVQCRFQESIKSVIHNSLWDQDVCTQIYICKHSNTTVTSHWVTDYIAYLYNSV